MRKAGQVIGVFVGGVVVAVLLTVGLAAVVGPPAPSTTCEVICQGCQDWWYCFLVHGCKC